ncbi:MAG: hypothetical protein IKK84_00235 [Clostridia bacterium]|nr:hypothetical protein [Clostridia bacterium]
MKARCYNKNVERYKNYGGRGIKVCDEWRDDFMAFYQWAIKNGYQDSLTLDRKNVNGDYEPSNCRWVTKETQANNTTRNHYISYKGETKTIAEWARVKGIPYKALFKRINDGWEVEKALNTEYRPNSRKVAYKGETKTIAEWARTKGIKYDTLKQRINKYHWDIAKALETP